jgi:hypothetical protein
MLSGTLYHLTGQQPTYRFQAREVFQTRWMLRGMLAKLGLAIREELKHSDSNRRTPVFVIEKVSPNVSRARKTNAWKFWLKAWAAEMSLLTDCLECLSSL